MFNANQVIREWMARLQGQVSGIRKPQPKSYSPRRTIGLREHKAEIREIKYGQ